MPQFKLEHSIEERKKLSLFEAYDDYFQARDEDLYNQDFEWKHRCLLNGRDPFEPCTLWHDMMKVVCGAGDERYHAEIRAGIRFLIDNLKKTGELEIMEMYVREGMDWLVERQAEDIAQKETEIEQEMLADEKQEAERGNQIQ